MAELTPLIRCKEYHEIPFPDNSGSLYILPKTENSEPMYSMSVNQTAPSLKMAGAQLVRAEEITSIDGLFPVAKEGVFQPTIDAVMQNIADQKVMTDCMRYVEVSPVGLKQVSIDGKDYVQAVIRLYC